jgi:D-alanyl-D-alanine carboxypeptidase/D-alanyl-D-alanine-endopeptidase (penicillin-binding protein 4)
VSRLLRPLTVVVAVLIALSAGALVAVRAHTGGRTTANSTIGLGRSPNETTSTVPAGSAMTTSPGTPALPLPPQSTGTTAAPTTTAPLSPLARLTAAEDGTLAGTDSCLLVEDASGRILYQHQPDAGLIPASTQKLLVAEAALATLGPNYRFTTSVVAPAAPVNGQVASMWLVGGGDPLLAAPEFVASTAGQVRVAGYPWTSLAALADKLAGAGITAVPGGVRGDDSYEDRLRFLPVWPALYEQQKQIGLLSALSVNEGIQFAPPQSPLAQDPPNYAASELARLLGQRHVAAAAGPDQSAPGGAVVMASISSAPLSQIVEAMLRASDNWIAELLVRAMDRAAGGAGTTAGGLAIVRRQAGAAGVPLGGVQMDDGSGLSRTDRSTCRGLLAALDLGNQPAYSAVLAGLPVAGETGTLALRYRGSPLAGRLQAKTGSLDNAGGMVGVLSGATPVRFAFLDNDVETDTALLAKEDAVVGALAPYAGVT